MYIYSGVYNKILKIPSFGKRSNNFNKKKFFYEGQN